MSNASFTASTGPIAKDSLLSLEDYHKARPELRQKAMQLRSIRKVFIGDNVMLQFESEATLRYQIQEILRVEKIFEEEAILEELASYNPLVPTGSNWKATQMIEFTDVEIRKQKLIELKGIERHTYMQIANHEKVYAIADEDLPRENEEKTSAVHFLRFELTSSMINALKAGAEITAGIDLPAYNKHVNPIAKETADSLLDDLI